MTITSSTSVGPITTQERIQILDIWRGFAVFGILLVNIAGFATPAFLPGYIHPDNLPWYDQLGEFLVIFFGEGKFYTIFSFLFGLGFSVQLARAESKGQDIRTFFPRRLWILFGLGLIHAVFLWTGDILRLYALLGFALLIFRKHSNRTLIIWTAIFFGLSLLLLGLVGGPTGGESDAIPGYDIVGMARQAYTSTNYLNYLVFQTILGIFSFIAIALTQGPSVMGLFLLGLLAGRTGIFEHLPENRNLLIRLFWIGLVIGITCHSLLFYTQSSWLVSLLFTLGAPALALAYASGLAWCSLQPLASKLIAPLSNVGRMALTNYVLQSVVCSVLFSGYGFGLYEQIGAAGLVGLTFLIYSIQIPLSAWWLSRFQFGPLEWVWRSLTYRQVQPFRKAQTRLAV